MKKIFSLLLSLCALLTLTACGPIYKTNYSYIPPQNGMGKMCAAQCVQGKNACQQSCEVTKNTCQLRAHQDALAKFQIYKQDRLRQGKKVALNVSAFDNSYSCNQSCACEDTFNTCYSTCGGQVITKKVCVAFCNKAAA